MNLKFDIDTTYNSINKYLSNDNKYEYNEDDVILFYHHDKINYDFLKDICEINDFVPITSNYVDHQILKYDNLSEEEINYFINKFNFNFNEININYSNYNLYHIRLNDSYFDQKKNIEKKKINELEKILLKNMNKNSLNILISNSKKFKDYMKNYDFIKIIDNIPVHTSFNKDTNIIKSVIEDIYLIKNANIIYTYSEYKWISGFILWYSKLYKKKLINMKR
jgi:hypothetical protein